MGIVEILGIGMGAVQAMDYAIKYSAYQNEFKSIARRAVDEGRATQEEIDESLKNIRKCMYLPLPFDVISLHRYLNQQIEEKKN